MTFDLKVGFTCNNNCIHCVITNKQLTKDSSTDKIKEIIKNTVDEGITFTGGEPTIRNDFIDLLYFTNKIGKKSFLQTNGRMFADRNFTKEVSKYLDSVLIAIHSHNNIIHDTITQRVNSWSETISGIKNIQEIGNINITSQTVLSKLNCDNLVKTYDFIQNNFKLTRMNMTFPHPNGSAYDNFEKVVPKYNSFRGVIQECIIKYKSILQLEAIPLCYIHPFVNETRVQKLDANSSHGGYDPANTGSIAFGENGIVDNYDKLILSEYRKPKTCILCIYNNQCMGVWKEYYDKYENELDLVPIQEKK